MHIAVIYHLIGAVYTIGGGKHKERVTQFKLITDAVKAVVIVGFRQVVGALGGLYVTLGRRFDLFLLSYHLAWFHHTLVGLDIAHALQQCLDVLRHIVGQLLHILIGSFQLTAGGTTQFVQFTAGKPCQCQPSQGQQRQQDVEQQMSIETTLLLGNGLLRHISYRESVGHRCCRVGGSHCRFYSGLFLEEGIHVALDVLCQ